MYFEFTTFHLVVTLILIGALMAVIQGTCAYLILAERKISAWAQDRVGPNRVGFDFGFNFFPFTLLRGMGGLGQPIADGLKFLLKEQVIPKNVDKIFYLMAPCIAVSTALLALAVIPFGPTKAAPVLLDYRTEEMLAEVAKRTRPMTPEEQERFIAENNEYQETPRGAAWPATETEKVYLLAADAAHARANGTEPFRERIKLYNSEKLDRVQFVIAPHVDIGVVFVLAIGSLAVYAIVLGGWSSNNKYSFLGSLRASAQMISYEIPMGMSLLGVFLITGSLNVERLIDYQVEQGWNVLFQPLACLLFIVSLFAECNRVPFDLPEAEQELVGGFHTEYSGMKFALFFLGEYTHMIATSFLVVALFFGGWHLPFVGELPGVAGIVVKLLVFAVKMALFIIFYMYIRWTIPRFRFDQLMGLAWKVMMPLALISLLIVLFVQHFRPLGEYDRWLMTGVSLLSLWLAAVVSLRMPKPPTRAPITYVGHPIHGVRRLSVN